MIWNRLLTLLVVACSCASYGGSELATRTDPEASRVLVVVNVASQDSVDLGHYYARKRSIPNTNILSIRTSMSDEIDPETFKSDIEAPIEGFVKSHDIDYIVLTLDTPIRLRGGEGFSVDGQLETMSYHPLPKSLIRWKANATVEKNPYFGSVKPFSHKATGLYIVTRLIGYDLEACRALVDHAFQAKRETGPFLMVEAANRGEDGYGELQQTLVRTAKVLNQHGFAATDDRSFLFPSSDGPLAGYCSWGSNDNHFNVDNFRALRFKPGAIAQTFVSTSGRTFHRGSRGQSLIADLIEQGVTGVAGYVSEPYTFGLARPDILFDRYTQGFSLGESFAAASPIVRWKEIVVGDPLCRPYARH